MILDIILISVLIVCLLTDLKHQKIYNKIIYPTLLAVIIIHTISNGFNGFKTSILGFVVGLCILLIPYFLGGIGAGDVKLLALIGAIKGSLFVLNTALYMALIGGVIALLIIMYKKELKTLFKTITAWLFDLFNGVKYKIEQPTSSLTQKYPYGIAIVGGALICFFFKGAWII